MPAISGTSGPIERWRFMQGFPNGMGPLNRMLMLAKDPLVRAAPSCSSRAGRASWRSVRPRCRRWSHNGWCRQRFVRGQGRQMAHHNPLADE